MVVKFDFGWGSTPDPQTPLRKLTALLRSPSYYKNPPPGHNSPIAASEKEFQVTFALNEQEGRRSYCKSAWKADWRGV